MKLVSPNICISRLALCSLIALVALGGSAFAEKIIHQFNSAAGDGTEPLASLVSKDGNLYGTTFQGGDFGLGTVFELSPPRAEGEAWTETVLHSFAPDEGAYNPISKVVFDKRGNLYGVGAVAAFELSPPSPPRTSWRLTVIAHFRANTYPQGLAGGLHGHFFGTMQQGGFNLIGGVFELTQLPNDRWSKTGVYSFEGGADGSQPKGPLAIDSSGNIYGTTSTGGDLSCSAGCGTVFKLERPTIPGGVWTKTLVYVFNPTNGDGYLPLNGVILDGHGNLYGTTAAGGSALCGTVFELSPPQIPGGPWTESVLYNFDGPSGESPVGLVMDSVGNLYGTGNFGGVGFGTVFRLSPPSAPGGAWIETTLHQFGTGFLGGDDGTFPHGVVLGPYGALYGTTDSGLGSSVNGTVFSIQP